MKAADTVWSSGYVDYIGDIGFVNTDNATGEWIEWRFNLSADTPAECVFRYACASSARSMDLSINGSRVTDLSFPGTGAWDPWGIETAEEVTLSAGIVTIRVTATTSGGAPNMDKMAIAIANGTIPLSKN